MVTLTAYFVNWVIIIKLNETKSPFLASLLLSDQADSDNVSERTEIILQVFFLDFLLEPTNKQFLDSGAGIRSVDLFPWHCPLGFHNSKKYHM